MLSVLGNLLADESGATAIEYGLIAALVSIAVISALQALAGNLSSVFQALCGAMGEIITANGGTATACTT